MVEKIFAKEISREMFISIIFVIVNIYIERVIDISLSIKFGIAIKWNTIQQLQ